MTLSMTGFIKLLKIIAAASSIFGITTLVTYILSVIKSVRYKYPYTIYDTLAIFKSNDFKNSRRVGIIIFLMFSLFAIVFTNTAALELMGNDTIELKPSGTYCYFVKIENDKYEYVLPGQIRVYADSIEFLEYTEYYKNYYIEKVYFSNGGYLYFEDFGVEVGKSSTSYDQNEREWTCTLTSESAYSPYIEETSNITSKSIRYLVFRLVCVMFAIICLICKKDRCEHKINV